PKGVADRVRQSSILPCQVVPKTSPAQGTRFGVELRVGSEQIHQQAVARHLFVGIEEQRDLLTAWQGGVVYQPADGVSNLGRRAGVPSPESRRRPRGHDAPLRNLLLPHRADDVVECHGTTSCPGSFAPASPRRRASAMNVSTTSCPTW